MNIIKTNINDIPNNLPKIKENLLNNIISYVQPLFDKEYINVIKEVKKLKNDIEVKKEQVQKEKSELEILVESINKKKKEQLLLDRIGKLVGGQLLQESMKKELIVLLKSFDGMKIEKINSYLNETMTIISKRFAKS